MIWEILMDISLDERGLPGGQFSDDEHFEEVLFQWFHGTVLLRGGGEELAIVSRIDSESI